MRKRRPHLPERQSYALERVLRRQRSVEHSLGISGRGGRRLSQAGGAYSHLIPSAAADDASQSSFLRVVTFIPNPIVFTSAIRDTRKPPATTSNSVSWTSLPIV